MVADPGRKLNLRDLGGLPTADGRRLRGGVLIRSEALTRFSPTELERLGRLGIVTVCDLRAPAERQAADVAWPATRKQPQLLELAIWGDEGPRGVGLKKESAASEDAFRAMMTAAYRSMPASLAEGGLASLVETMLVGRVPVMVHCSQGKDRTGVLVALLCAAAGVERETIREDYLLTNSFFDRAAAARQTAASLAGPGAPLADLDPAVARALDAHVEYLDAAWEEIDRAYGSIDAYLDLAAGFGDPDRRRRFRTLMTEPAPAGA